MIKSDFIKIHKFAKLVNANSELICAEITDDNFIIAFREQPHMPVTIKIEEALPVLDNKNITNTVANLEEAMERYRDRGYDRGYKRK